MTRRTVLLLSGEKMEMHKAAKIASDILWRWYLHANVTSFFYHIMLDGSLSHKHTTLPGSKKSMNHVTVLYCSNTSGTDRQKLLVVGKRAKPQCFKRISMDHLPVLYYANKNLWMTSEIAKKWLMSWDVKLQWKSRKILLALDNCAVHPHLDSLKNIQLVFLSPNTTSLVQPMAMGIKKFDDLYHNKVGKVHPLSISRQSTDIIFNS
jgi:hypothetical protein